MRSRQRRASILVLLLGGTLAIAGCGDATVSGAPSSVASVEPSTAPSTGPSATTASAEPSAAPSATAAPTESPAASATTAPESPSPSASASAGFTCTFPYRHAATTSAVVQLTDVRVGAHPGSDRIVFEFAGGRLPSLRLDAVDPPFTMDPSDQPLTVAGKSFVLIRLVYASGGGYSTTDGKETYTGPDRFSPRYERLTSLVEAGDFEAHMSWVAGFTGSPCYRVTRLARPPRYVIDFQTP